MNYWPMSDYNLSETTKFKWNTADYWLHMGIALYMYNNYTKAGISTTSSEIGGSYV